MQCPPLNNPRAPRSQFFAVEQTPNAGRGVFAVHDIPTGTLLLEAADLTTSTIHRAYRKEVCAHCFAYDRGVIWPVREVTTGFAFCTQQCRQAWEAFVGEDGVIAYEAIETLFKKKQPSADEADILEEKLPTLQTVEAQWSAASARGALIVAARKSARPSKSEKRALQTALQSPAIPSVLPYLLSGVLTAARMPDQWSSILVLHANPVPYSSSSHLHEHITSYLHLLAVVPISLLPWTTTANCYILATRDAQNAFGLRSLDDGGDEVFGYGDWPSASYWNHNCTPNVSKRRTGRMWQFQAQRNIEAGEQLCITYLGGDERKMDVVQRRERLRKDWGFHCLCTCCAAADPIVRTGS